MADEELFGDEEQTYKDQLKRIGKNIQHRIGQEFKKIDFIRHYYPNLDGLWHVENLVETFELVSPALKESEINRARLENVIKTLKYVLHELRHAINSFEEQEGLHYEFGLAQLLARKGNIAPEQVAPLYLKDLPDIGSIGGKKRKPKTKKHKTTKKHKKTKKHK